MGKDEGLAIAGSVVLGTLGLVYLAAALAKKSNCPICNVEIFHGIPQCPNCKVGLKWN